MQKSVCAVQKLPENAMDVYKRSCFFNVHFLFSEKEKCFWWILGILCIIFLCGVLFLSSGCNITSQQTAQSLQTKMSAK